MENQKKKFNAVVIDDEEYRNDTYLKVLSKNFNVRIINDLAAIKHNEVMKYDILIIDVWFGDITAFQIMKDYCLTLPTVLISGRWIESDQPSDIIFSVPEYRNIIKLISWNSFNKEGSNAQIGQEIFYRFCNYNQYLISDNKQKFSMLQLSDLQFGGNEAEGAFNDSFRIAQFLKEQAIDPDIIVITGDIADKGKEVEYKKAYEWLETLIKEIWEFKKEVKDDILKRIVIVPGNHDYDLSISASDYHDFHFDAAEQGTFDKKESAIPYINQKLGFYNFIQFMYKFSKDLSSYKYMDKAIHLNDTFKDWGIRFITLNSAYNINSDNCENRFDKFYCDLSSIDESKLISGVNGTDNLCNILVTHNPPNSFKRETPNGQKSWGRMQGIIQDNKVNIIMSGHTHDFKQATRLRDSGGKYCREAICISAPSARLDAASRTSDADRGFNVIDFYRKDGIIDKIIPRYFSMKKATITEITDYTEEFSIK